MTARNDGAGDAFFVGWARPPRGLSRFLLGVGIGLIALFGLVGYLVAATQVDPGDGGFRGWGRQTVTGILTADPYPVVHVVESDRYPVGHTLLLSGQGKRGVQARAEALDGQLVVVSGAPMNRGSINMLQLRGGANGMQAADVSEEASPVETPTAEPLGRWRLTGEICDGKCYTGAMRPGTGLAHRACANLCLIGGAPPVFVSTGAVDGEVFFLLGDAEGGPVTDAVLDHVGLLVDVEGSVERRGTLMVFRIDPETLGLAE